MSLINEALKRADAEKGPRRPQPLPPPVSPSSPAAAPPPAPAGRWRSIQTAVLGGALLVVLVAGAWVWKMFNDSPVQVIASPPVAAAESRAPATAAQATPAPAPTASGPSSGTAISDRPGGPPAFRTAGAAPARPMTSDPLMAAANPTNPMKDVFRTQPTLFMDAHKSQEAGGDASLDRPDGRPAATEPAGPIRLSSAFAAPVAGAPQPAPTKPATPASAPPVAAAPAPPAPQAPAPAAEAPRLKVTSIFYSSRSPTAIINGQVIGVGEVIDGAKIAAITPRTVEVLIDGRRVTLRL